MSRLPVPFPIADSTSTFAFSRSIADSLRAWNEARTLVVISLLALRFCNGAGMARRCSTEMAGYIEAEVKRSSSSQIRLFSIFRVHWVSQDDMSPWVVG